MKRFHHAGRSSLFAFVVSLFAMDASSTGAEPAAHLRLIDADYVNLPAATLVAAMASRDAQMNQRAKMYLLGIFDATEGVVWCDYSRFKTVSLREYVYEALRKRVEANSAERAATAVREALRELSPCGRNP